MTANPQLVARPVRAKQLERALFRGGSLTLDNHDYRRAVEDLTATLLRGDSASRDLTVEALGMKGRSSTAVVVARESGVAAGLEEAALLLRTHGVETRLERKDGDQFEAGEAMLTGQGDEGMLLSLERVLLNILQRMSGIATAARRLDERARRHSPYTHVVGTRKTLWGLLDKRALHVGNGGTHRLGLGDAILIKNNHLARLAASEEEAVEPAIERAWTHRGDSAFIEVEVRGEGAARQAAKAFLRLQEKASEEYPCLLMLDNMPPAQVSSVLDMLQRERLWDSTLIESSGGVSVANLDAYAACGVDAISIGALTHSTRALDLGARIS
jgi:nicotinate-nucleotide pyrophosphorylase (carboxylating)